VFSLHHRRLRKTMRAGGGAVHSIRSRHWLPAQLPPDLVPSTDFVPCYF
jgi:hypothetical protein